MKQLLIGILILILLLGACWFSSRQIRESCYELSGLLQKSLDAQSRGSTDARDRYLRQAAHLWARKEPILDALLSHVHTGEITAALHELPFLSGSDYAARCRAALEILRIIRRLDEIRWENVF